MAELYGLYEDASVAAIDTRPAAVQQLQRMLVVALAAEWQGFARDLYYDAVETVTATMAEREREPVGRLLRVSLTWRRRLDRGQCRSKRTERRFPPPRAVRPLGHRAHRYTDW
ncbi:MAG: hypothetical protein ACR2MA_09135 [Egibacteraceae bacterium]